MTYKPLFFFLLFILLINYCQAQKQFFVYYNEDEGNYPISGAKISFIKEKAIETTYTDQFGFFKYNAIPDVNCLMLIEAKGFIPQTFSFDAEIKKYKLISLVEFYKGSNNDKKFNQLLLINIHGKITNNTDNSPIQGAIIKILNTPYIGVSDANGDYSLQCRFDEFIISRTNPLTFYIEKQNYTTAIYQFDKKQFTEAAEYKGVNFSVKKLHPLDEINSVINKRIGELDSINLLNKKSIDDLNWKITNGFSSLKRIEDSLNELEDSFLSIRSQIEELRNSDSSILDSVKIVKNLIKANYQDQIIFNKEINNKLSNTAKALIDSSISSRAYTDTIYNRLRREIGLSQPPKEPFKISIKVAPFTLYSEGIVAPAINKFPSDYSLYFYLGKQKDLSLNLDCYPSDTTLGLFLNYQINPFLNKRAYGLIGLGTMYKKDWQSPLLAAQLSINYDLFTLKMITFSVSANYQIAFEKRKDVQRSYSVYCRYFNPSICIIIPFNSRR